MTGYIKNLRKYVGHDPLIQCGASVIDIVFTARSFRGEANINDESHGFKFFSIDEIPEMISPPVIPVVDKFKERYRAGDV